MSTRRYGRAGVTLAASCAALLATAAPADNISVPKLCAGMKCAVWPQGNVSLESFETESIKLKDTVIRLKFEDVHDPVLAPDSPSDDWQIIINDAELDSDNDGVNEGIGRFSIQDLTGNRIPFTIQAGARKDAIYADEHGNIGLGTSDPGATLDITEGAEPTFRLTQDGRYSNYGWPRHTWDVGGRHEQFFVRDATNLRTPLRVLTGAPTGSLEIQESGAVTTIGRIGIGTTSPETTGLHIKWSPLAPVLRLEHKYDPSDPQIWDLVGHGNAFQIRDHSNGGKRVVSIEPGAREHALYVKGYQVGLGTDNPQSTLHLRQNGPTIRLTQTPAYSGDGQVPQTDWLIHANHESFKVRDAQGGTRTPFTIQTNAPGNSVHIKSDGNVGIGSSGPERKLHLRWEDDVYARVESLGDSAGVEIFNNSQQWQLYADEISGALRFRELAAANDSLAIDADGHTFLGAMGSAGNGAVSTLTSVNTLGGNLAYAALLENRDDTDDGSTYAALGFSANSTTVPKSAILHQRTGTGGTGRLHFALNADTSDAAPVSQADIRMSIDQRGNVGIGGSDLGNGWSNVLHLFVGDPPTGGITNAAMIFADHYDDLDPATVDLVRIQFADEAGNVRTVTPHDFTGYTPDPSDPYPWSYHSRNDYLGEEVWADMSGALRTLEEMSGKTFIHRRRFRRADWDAAKLAEAEAAREQQVLRKMGETVEVAPEDAVEQVPVMQEAEGKLTETVYSFDRKTGTVVATQRKIMIQEPTGHMEHRIKPGVRLDPRTGKFFRNKTRAEAEAEVPPAQPKPMPQWMAERLNRQPTTLPTRK